MGKGFIRGLLLSASFATLAACGTGRNSAPVVYGTQPAATGRIYNSPAETRAAQRQTYQPPAYASAAPARNDAYSAPSRLTPVSSSVIEDDLPPVVAFASYEEVQSPPSGLLITVRPGDTVYAIARRTGASPQAIIAENNLRPPYTLRVGDTLRAPSPAEKISNSVASRPVAAQPVSTPRAGVRVVRRGDTLYSISRQTGATPAAIAEANRLRAPYTLAVGQELIIPGRGGEAPQRLEREAGMDVGDLAREVSYTKPAPPTGRMFDWPVKGAIIGEYGSVGKGRRNDGVNIAAPVGTPVRAAAEGEVVYRGSELDGYGNLLLIKHGDGFVTAYAHNDVMLVRKGQKVQQGQVIAKVGQTGAASEPQLHFEIRQNLKSVDPLAFLQ